MNYSFVMILGLTGGIFLIAGAIMGAYPPKQINDWYGYRTKRSKSSQEAWDISQVYAAKQMMTAGVLMMVLGGIRWCFPYYQEFEILESIAAIVLMIVLSLGIIIKTEKKLKND